ncbi:MAG: response regulator [Anaeromyxobacter sp.]
MKKRAPVLLVDDDDVLRTAVARLLRHTGLEVVEAHDGGEALALLGAEGLRPGVIVTDLQMPRVGGAALVQAVRSAPALDGVPIVLVSGGEMRDVGADRYLAKPYSPTDLLDTMDALARAG